jgi:pimeloyl-ACP methyl ester carboxylesterase
MPRRVGTGCFSSTENGKVACPLFCGAEPWFADGMHAFRGSVLWGVLLMASAGCAGPREATRTSSSAAPAYDAELTGFEYPFPVQFRDFESQRQKLRMAYMDVKPSNPNGRAVLLLHGKNFSGAYWDDTIRALTEQGYRVVVPDQIGFGKSSKPERYQFTFHALATHTRDLLDEVGVDKVSVVGHSMGGMVATRFALMFPDRVEKLALVNPIGLEDWKRHVPYMTVDQVYREELKKSPEGIQAYMRQFYFGGDWKPEYDALVDMLAGWTRGPDHERIAWVGALTQDMVFTQPVLYEFPDLRAPTLLIIGQRDRTAIGRAAAPPEIREQLGDYPKLGRKAAEAIPNAALVELPGVGHMPQVEAWDAYRDALLQFLGQ